MSRSERMSSVDTTWLRMVALDKVEKQIAEGHMSYIGRWSTAPCTRGAAGNWRMRKTAGWRT